MRIDALTVDLDDDVACAEVGHVRGPALVDFVEQDADIVFEADGIALGVCQVIRLEAHPATNDPSVNLDLLNYAAHEIDRNRKADAFGAGVLGQDRGIDADEFAGDIDEGAARIARVDRCVGLDEVLEGCQVVEVAAPGAADDALRHRLG